MSESNFLILEEGELLTETFPNTALDFVFLDAADLYTIGQNALEPWAVDAFDLISIIEDIATEMVDVVQFFVEELAQPVRLVSI
jgi:hypothetical protein